MRGVGFPRSGEEVLKRPLVCVVALDHFSEEWALGVQEEVKPMFITVVGWLIGEDENYLYLANRFTENASPDRCTVSAVLKSTIVDMWELKKAAKEHEDKKRGD